MARQDGDRDEDDDDEARMFKAPEFVAQQVAPEDYDWDNLDEMDEDVRKLLLFDPTDPESLLDVAGLKEEELDPQDLAALRDEPMHTESFLDLSDLDEQELDLQIQSVLLGQANEQVTPDTEDDESDTLPESDQDVSMNGDDHVHDHDHDHDDPAGDDEDLEGDDDDDADKPGTIGFFFKKAHRTDPPIGVASSAFAARVPAAAPAPIAASIPAPAVPSSGRTPKPYEVRAAAKKREARSGPAHEAKLQAQRLDTAGTLDDELAEVWAGIFDELLERHRRIEAVLQSCPRDAPTAAQRDMLRALFNLTRDLDKVERVPADSPFWMMFDQFNEADITFFAALARGLEHADIQRALAAGALRLSNVGDETPFTGCFTYLRVGSDSDPEESALRLLAAQPADAPATFIKLRQLGMGVDAVQTTAEQLLKPYRHGGAVEQIFAEVNGLETVKEAAVRWYWLYGGTTHEERPWARQAADQVAANQNVLPSRMGRFLQANADDVRWCCYEIPALFLPDSPGIRTDPVASACEAFVIAMQAGRGLNISIGGFFRPYSPDAELAAILTTVPPSIYGHVDAVVQDRVAGFFDDQRSFIAKHLERPIMPAPAFVSAKKNGPETLQSNGHGVVFIRWMKDISLEDFRTEGRAPYQENTGKALQLFRHILSLCHPALRVPGDISLSNLRQHAGASFDWWAFITGTPDIWVHDLHGSRLMIVVEPIVTSVWSNPVFSAFAMGHLQLVWQNIPEDIQHSFLAGVTPSSITEFLPPPHDDLNWHATCTDGAYHDVIGTLLVAQYGPSPAALTLLIPNIDCGASKYRAGESALVEEILTLVCAIESVALQHVQMLHDAGINPDRTDASQTRGYFEELKDRVEFEVEEIGLRARLTATKASYHARAKISRHLEAQRRPTLSRGSPLSRAPPYEIPGFTRTSTPGPAREVQLQRLLAHFDSQVQAGFPEDAFRLIPFHLRDHVHTDEFRDWFLGLPEDIRISCSAQVWGNSAAANDRTLANQAAFAGNTAAHRKGGKATADKTRAAQALANAPATLLRRWIQETADPIRSPPPRRKYQSPEILASSDTWRHGECPRCSERLFAVDENAKHLCTDGTKYKIIDSVFDYLSRVAFPHHLLGHPDLRPLIPRFLDLVTELDVATIFADSDNRAQARQLFPALDFQLLTGRIYVANNCVQRTPNNTRVQIAMSLDLVAESPPNLWPVTSAEIAKAWVGDADAWLHDDYYVVRCAFGHFGIQKPRTGPYFDHACRGTILQRLFPQGSNTRVVGRRAKGLDRDCGTQWHHKIVDIYDLPPAHLRRHIMKFFITPHQAPPAKPKKRHSRASEPQIILVVESALTFLYRREGCKLPDTRQHAVMEITSKFKLKIPAPGSHPLSLALKPIFVQSVTIDAGSPATPASAAAFYTWDWPSQHHGPESQTARPPHAAPAPRTSAGVVCAVAPLARLAHDRRLVVVRAVVRAVEHQPARAHLACVDLAG
ncbi:hypothetical protein FB451DRAFT_1177329 [Mycena latifolia]|nr:hypothetical protein FB451DRAFT_1177329 [Mycena latifolia]